MNTSYTPSSIAGVLDTPARQESGKTIFEYLHEWVTTVDHKRLGIMYIVYALAFFVVGGIEATIMRIQLARPDNHFLAPQVFNRLFTMHGTTMVFLRRHAHRVRVRQLPRAADDRRARHGVPAPERVQLLADRVRGAASLLQPPRRRGA